MATRRKYRAPQGYRDGGRVPLADDAVEASPAPVSAEVPPPVAWDGNPMIGVLNAARRAEEMQRQARPLTVEQYIDALPGLSEHKRSFLKAHPEMLTGAARDIMAANYGEALQKGILDDSAEMDEWLAASVRHDLEQRHREALQAGREAASRSHQVERLDAEAAAIGSDMRSLGPVSEIVTASPREIMPSPRPASRRMPMTAPPSREVPSVSGRPAVDRQVRLSPEERDIARRSFSAPGMTNEQKEWLYAQNKLKLRQMRSAGVYPEPERN